MNERDAFHAAAEALCPDGEVAGSMGPATSTDPVVIRFREHVRSAEMYFRERLAAMDDQGRTDALLLAANRIGELQAAVTAARNAMLAVVEADSEAAFGDASGVAAQHARDWLDRFGPLGVQPQIEIEDDDDPEDTPTEGALWVKESSKPGSVA